MLNSSSSEDLQNQTAGKVPVVSLPQDDAEAFTIMCRIFHYCADEIILRGLAVDCLMNIAILCDKYECVQAISASSVTWFQQIDPLPFSEPCLSKLLYVAYMLEAPQAFSRISLEIIFRHIGSYDPLEELVEKYGLNAIGLKGMFQQARLIVPAKLFSN